MNSTRYTYEVKDTDETTHYGRLLNRVGAKKVVLELGASTGYLSEVMTKQFGCSVYGVEIDPIAAEEARPKCADIKIADLDVSDVTTMFPDKQFDVALCADVLEHLRNPERTLKQVRKLLKPDGYIIASIPNISHGSIQLALLSGRFPYRSMGLLDETHVKFFTRQLVEEVFDQAGFKIDSVERNRWSAFTTEVADSLAHDPYFDSCSQPLSLNPESDTYQFIVRASLKPETPADIEPKTRHKTLELVVVEQPGAPLDDLYRNYLGRIMYPKDSLSVRLLKKDLTAESAQLKNDNSKPYADHDFRTFRFLKQGVPDEGQTKYKDGEGTHLNQIGFGEALGRGLRRAMELAASAGSDLVAICLSNTLPRLDALKKLTEKIDPNTVAFARPEILCRQEAILQTEGKISWQIPSLFMLHPKTAARCLELWTDSDFKTIEAQSANFCFSLLAGGVELKSIDAPCFRFGPILDHAPKIALIDGIKLRLTWGSSRHKMSFFKNCVMPSRLRFAEKAQLLTAVALGTASGKNGGGAAQTELITFGGAGASLVGARTQQIDNPL